MPTDRASLIAAIDRASTSEELVRATWALAKAEDATAIATLIKVLGYNNPGAAVAAVEGLVALGETAVPLLVSQLDGYDYGARAWAIRALSRIGDPRALEILLDSASGDFALSVRRAAAKGLGSLRWPHSEPSTDSDRAIEVLKQAARDPEWVVRYAAIVGLEGLATQFPQSAPSILTYLETLVGFESELVVIARIRWAIANLTGVLMR